MTESKPLVNTDDVVLVTGANGFVGSRVVAALLRRGFTKIRCFVRPSGNVTRLREVIADAPDSATILRGNLLSRDDCRTATRDVSLVLHLAAGIEKSYPGSFLNSVVTTRNLIEEAQNSSKLRRFVNTSSFSVYSNSSLRRGAVLDETCDLEDDPVSRNEAYCYAKLKQDELVMEYGRRSGLPYVIARPGVVYGPGKPSLTGRVGIDTFGVFLHIGGSNRLPLTYVDNCAEAIVAAGLAPGIDGEVVNIVDDDLPTSRRFLRMYKKEGRRFFSLFVPYSLFYLGSWLWERYADWSAGQLPPIFNRRRCRTYWKGQRYSNSKLKRLTGWAPAVPFQEAARRYLADVREAGRSG